MKATRARDLYRRPIPARRTGSLYNAFSYPTKISPETIALYIATHTKPGDTVLDVFAGSGTTGLAAKLCDAPTNTMLEQARAVSLAPVWGPRNAVLYELNVLGAFIGRVMTDPPDPVEFTGAAEAVLASARGQRGWLYEALDDESSPGELRHVIWSDALVCPHCSAEILYWDARVRFAPLRLERDVSCESCGMRIDADSCDRALKSEFDPLLGHNIERKRRHPVVIYGVTGRRNWRRPVTPDDLERIERTRAVEISSKAPVRRVEWGDLHRAGYHRGISHVHHFYTHRNFAALDALWTAIASQPAHLHDSLKLLVLSFNASHATDMTRVVVKKGQADFVLTGAQSGVLYVSGLPVEKNVFRGVARKVATFRDAFALVRGSRSTVRVENASSTRLDLQDESVDYVFTDPPFGDYIPYAELSQLNEAWLGEATPRAEEAIVSRSQSKGLGEYAQLMTRVLLEVNRATTPAAALTMVFHSAHADVWNALIGATEDAGLRLKDASVLDKVQASFKQVVSGGSVKGDLTLLLEKAPARRRRQAQRRSIDEIVSAVVSAAAASPHPVERSRERLFSRFVSACLKEGVPVRVDAAQFYALPAVLEAAH